MQASNMFAWLFSYKTRRSWSNVNNYILKAYQIKRKMEDLALKLGYLPYEPSLFENYEHFSSLSCDVKKEQLVTVINGQKFQLLRPDITTTIMNNVHPFVQDGEELKLFYQSTVYRSLDSGIKSVNQFGIEHLGIGGTRCERDVLDLAISYLKDVPYIIEVGTTKFLNKILQLCNLDAQQEKVFRKLIYIKNREELIKFARLHSLHDQVQEILPDLFTLRGTYDEVASKLKNYALGNSLINTLSGVNYLTDFDQQVIVDLSMTSDLTYYDGVIFKGYYRSVPEAVLSGGRYGTNAIGFSIDVDNWLKVQKKEGSTWNT